MLRVWRFAFGVLCLVCVACYFGVLRLLPVLIDVCRDLSFGVVCCLLSVVAR